MDNSPTFSEEAAAARLLIVDGHAYAYRAFYAIRHLNSPSGRATNAIYGFIRMLGRMLARVQPTHTAVIWDGGLADERMALHLEYKAQRAEMPSDLEPQLDEIVAYLGAANIVSFMKEGLEADDCIAAMTRQAVAAGIQVVIASADKDFMQLVSPQVLLLNPGDKTETLWGPADVKRKTGVDPTQIVDWLSLIGDTVDNIPGVPGVGPKTAASLLQQFGSISELYRRLPEVTSERVRTVLQTSVEIVRRNQQLVRLKDDVPCELPMEELRVRQCDYRALGELFSGWGFKTLLRELAEAHNRASDFFSHEVSKT